MQMNEQVSKAIFETEELIRKGYYSKEEKESGLMMKYIQRLRRCRTVKGVDKLYKEVQER